MLAGTKFCVLGQSAKISNAIRYPQKIITLITLQAIVGKNVSSASIDVDDDELLADDEQVCIDIRVMLSKISQSTVSHKLYSKAGVKISDLYPSNVAMLVSGLACDYVLKPHTVNLNTTLCGEPL
jgi:hypothetical protein